jgi:hypothetical protein
MSEFDPNALGTPNRGTSEPQLDQWNQAMRQSRVYQDFMRRQGLATDGRVRLSRQQQSSLEAELRAAGFNIPSGMHIDQGGNLNQKNRLVRNSLIGAGIAGGGLAAAGLAGVGPFSGLAGGSAAGSASASASGAGAGAGGLAPIAGGSPWAVTPYAATAASVPTGAAAVGGSVGAAGAAGALGGAASGLSSLLGGLSASELAALGLTAAGTIGAATQDRPQFGPNTMTADPNLQALMQSMQRRLDKSEPLYDSVLNMANGLLPTQYQRGGGGMG